MNEMNMALAVARKVVSDFIDAAEPKRWFNDWFEDEKDNIKDFVYDMADKTPYEEIAKEAALRVIRTLCIDVDEEVYGAAYEEEYEDLVNSRD